MKLFTGWPNSACREPAISELVSRRCVAVQISVSPRLIDPNVLVDAHHFIGITDFLLRLLHHFTGGRVGCAVLGGVLPIRAL